MSVDSSNRERSSFPDDSFNSDDAPPSVRRDSFSDSLNDRTRRLEITLQQIDSLPTLSAVAARVWQLAGNDDSRSDEVVRLISTDPALAANILKLCRSGDRGSALSVYSVESAVEHLGFDAVRSAILSVQMFEVLDEMESTGGEFRHSQPVFNRATFWQHSLAVASISELLAETTSLCRNVKKPDAFLSGLLHDLGMLALHIILPNTFDRMCEKARAQGLTLDNICRSVIGLDTHTTGRRLAEHWRLPHSLGDVLWLHGQRLHTLPDFQHRSQIALVTLADVVARHNFPTPCGHDPRSEDIDQLTEELGITADLLDDVIATFPNEVAGHCNTLGLNESFDSSSMIRTVSHANEALGRINVSLRTQAQLSHRQRGTLEAMIKFYDSASPGGSVVTVMGKVIQSAAGVFGGGFFAILYQQRLSEPWQFIQFATDGRPIRSQLIYPPKGSTAISDLADTTQVSMQALSMLPWLCDYLGDSHDLRRVQLLPLHCGWGVNAVLLHDCSINGRESQVQLEALGRTWAAAIAAGAQHEGAKRLGEQLADSNRTLLDTQEELAQSQALASLGEIAAGAAHEMNNPLTIISGRSQLLANRLTEPSTRTMAEQIVEQSHRLSDMITALRLFAEPTQPDLQPVELRQLLDTCIGEVCGRYESCPEIQVHIPNDLPHVSIDSDQMSRAVIELLRNAVESADSKQILITVQIESSNDRLNIQVTDDGAGLSPVILTHAFDPFFSAKPAGRQPGLGLAQARRIVEAHGGQLTLENGSPQGAVAIIRLPRWRTTPKESRRVA